MKFEFLSIIIFGLLNSNNGEKIYLQFDETLEYANVYLKEVSEIEDLIKIRQVKMIEFKEYYIKNILPWYNKTQTLIENFYINYNPHVMELKNISVEIFQENFHQMIKKVEVEMKKSSEIDKLTEEAFNESSEAQLNIKKRSDFIHQNSFANFIRQIDILGDKVEIFAENLAKVRNFNDLEKIGNFEIFENWKRMEKMRSDIFEGHEILRKKELKGEQNRLELANILKYNTNRCILTNFLLDELGYFSHKSNAMAMLDIINVIEKIDTQRKEIEKIGKREDLQNLQACLNCTSEGKIFGRYGTHSCLDFIYEFGIYSVKVFFGNNPKICLEDSFEWDQKEEKGHRSEIEKKENVIHISELFKVTKMNTWIDTTTVGPELEKKSEDNGYESVGAEWNIGEIILAFLLIVGILIVGGIMVKKLKKKKTSIVEPIEKGNMTTTKE